MEAQTLAISVAFGDNAGHGHQHRLRMQLKKKKDPDMVLGNGWLLSWPYLALQIAQIIRRSGGCSLKNASLSPGDNNIPWLW